MVRVAVLTVSDRAARGERADESGPTVERMVIDAGHEVVTRAVVADDRDDIEAVLVAWSDGDVADVILTTGGTGLGPRDVTPEATRAVIEREIPGIPEAMRVAGLAVTPYAALSRQACGQRRRTLVVNLPGSPKAASECLDAVLEVLPHAVQLLRDERPG